MTATFPHPSISEENPFGLSHWKAALLEPVLMLVVALFWIAVLPITGIFCASVAIYDRLSSFKSSDIRLPNLHANRAANPLVLRRTGPARSEASTQRGGATRVAQA